MPIQAQLQQHGLDDSARVHDHDTANAILQAPQTLGIVAAPSSHLCESTPPADDLFPSAGGITAVNGSAGRAVGLGRPVPGALSVLSQPMYMSYTSSHHETPERSTTTARQPEELHIPQPYSEMNDLHHFQAPPAYVGMDGLSIQLQPSTPQQSSSTASNPVPGALQPGSLTRPGPSSSNTAPGTVPTLPQISTQMQHPPTSNRSASLNHTHSYSRSSPAGLDQPRYKPFSNTPEISNYNSPMTAYAPQTPQGTSYSPLGLADIRSRNEAGFLDAPLSPIGSVGKNDLQYPTSSNYVAPWPIYAIDWCKWPARSNGAPAGKVAIGSYLEDNHNYVCMNPRTAWLH